jgi:hypothetical protein
MLFIASLLVMATPLGVGHAQTEHLDVACQSIATAASHAADANNNAWLPASSEVSLRAYGSLRAREIAPVRVLGHCIVKAAPENAQPVLYVPFASQLDDSDDEDLASTSTEAETTFGHPAKPAVGPAALVALRASVGQLERPPRV